MILVPQPSMALNSVDVEGAHIQMWNTRLVQEQEKIENVLDNVASVANDAHNQKLQVLVINSHGFYRETNIGTVGGFGIAIGTGIRLKDLDKFSKIAGKVNQIWITACGVARIAEPGVHGDGNLFCSQLAQQSQSYVIASTQYQSASDSIPPFFVDDWSGLVLCYNPKGGVEWSKKYASAKKSGELWED
jgi:hypothetical protein